MGFAIDMKGEGRHGSPQAWICSHPLLLSKYSVTEEPALPEKIR